MLSPRPWLPPDVARRVDEITAQTSELTPASVAERLRDLADRNHAVHGVECLNLNPASNVMNPHAETLLAAGLGTRASLGYPGEKCETGVEAIEEIEVIAASLAAQVFGARFAEVRVPSGAIANLYGFIATCKPGDTIVAPPAAIGGHVTHHAPGAAGLYGL